MSKTTTAALDIGICLSLVKFHARCYILVWHLLIVNNDRPEANPLLREEETQKTESHGTTRTKTSNLKWYKRYGAHVLSIKIIHTKAREKKDQFVSI